MNRRVVLIAIPEGVARDFIAPWVTDAPIEARRKDAVEEIEQLIRNELARVPQPRSTFRMRAIASDVEGHVGHRVTVSTDHGVVTRLHCEDCGTPVEVEPS